MVTMETEHFEPRVQTASPEFPPLTNQGQPAHLDGGFLQTITKASGGGRKKNVAAYFLHAKENMLRTEREGSPSTNPVAHRLWPPAGPW